MDPQDNKALTNEEIVDFVSKSATLIENLKSEVSALKDQSLKLASEKAKLEDELQEAKGALYRKTASRVQVAEPKKILSKEQADLLANNLAELNLIKSASAKPLSSTLQSNPEKMVDVFNGVLAKIATSHLSMQGRPVTAEVIEVKKLTEEEELERVALK